MFVGTSGAVLPQVVRSLAGYGLGPDKVLINALLLNVALIIFSWRSYRQLGEEVHERRNAEEQARHLAETGPLTGRLNKRSFGDAMEQIMRQAGQSGQVLPGGSLLARIGGDEFACALNSTARIRRLSTTWLPRSWRRSASRPRSVASRLR
jgi:GGDEF domain-containing protein